MDTLHRAMGAAPIVRPQEAPAWRGQVPSRVDEQPYHGFQFLCEWLRNPVATAAVAPSGKALTSLITRGVHADMGAILELGPGTGAFTQGLVRRGVAQRALTLVEQNPTFARLLAKRFPDATILGIDAAKLADTSTGGGQPFDAVICGLGLRGMDARQVEAIMRAAFTRMRPDASLYLFTYGWKCSVPEDVLMRLGLGAERVGTTLRNVPPASVYRLATLSDAL
jgi:phospholipid N-methyltransferase